MDSIIGFLSRPFTLIMRWSVGYRAALVTALLLLVVFLLWQVLGRFIRAVLGGLVKAVYLILFEFFFHMMQTEKGQAKVESRNALTEWCEKLYNKLQPPKEKRRKPRIGRFIFLYIVFLFLTALPSLSGAYIPGNYMPAVSFAANIACQWVAEPVSWFWTAMGCFPQGNRSPESARLNSFSDSAGGRTI